MTDKMPEKLFAVKTDSRGTHLMRWFYKNDYPHGTTEYIRIDKYEELEGLLKNKNPPSVQRSNVSQLFEHMATCPDCDGSLWTMLTEPPPEDDGTAKIIATECDNCKLKLHWT